MMPFREEFETEVEIDDEDKKREAKATIKWKADFECRSWGIKSIYIIIPDQKLSVCWKTFSEEEDTYEDAELEIKDCKYELDVHVNGEVICPERLVISDGEFLLQF